MTTRWTDAAWLCFLARAILVLMLASFSSTPTPASDERIHSLGLPQQFRWYGGPGVGAEETDGKHRSAAVAALGVYRCFSNQAMDAMGLALEGYGQYVDNDWDGGTRVLGMSRGLGLHLGVDYRFGDDSFDAIVGFEHPIRRGGLLGMGGSVRFDWLPTRGHSYAFSFFLPIGQKHMGETRPKRIDQQVAQSPKVLIEEPEFDTELATVMASLSDRAHWIARFTTPFFDEKDQASFVDVLTTLQEHIQLGDERFPNGHTYEAEIDAFHSDLQRAFALASGSPERGLVIAEAAQQVLLEEVLVPFDRHLGEIRKPAVIRAHRARAVTRFDAWTQDQLGSAHSRTRTREVFVGMLEVIGDVANALEDRWGSSRLVWLPLQYALRQDQHDTQSEVDALLEKVIDERFYAGHNLDYLINEQFQAELLRSILAAEDYHVLWIHDFRGVNDEKQPDKASLHQVAQGYLEALTRHVQSYDKTGKIPTYLMILDQFFFEVNKSRLYVELLDNPLDAGIDLPPGHDDMEQTLIAAQQRLRDAVSGSERLQEAARVRRHDWLRNTVKVHVNVTHPPDPSFRSRLLIPWIPMLPDNVIRDHRKIAFYDVTEEDPGRGEGILTGEGVGEHYTFGVWEDRALRVRGPTLIGLKTAARNLLLRNGMNPDEIPTPLREMAKSSDYDARVAALEARGLTERVLHVHNRPGYQEKRANALKATLYTMMPRGSVMYIPDSLWNNPVWASMAWGAALRGCHVLVIAPTRRNAPSAGIPQMERAEEMFSRLVIVRNRMRAELEKSGGSVRTGLYDINVDVNDLYSRMGHFRDGAREKWYAVGFPFDDAFLRTLDSIHNELVKRGVAPADTSKAPFHPKLHLKTQLFFSEDVIRNILPRPEWEQVLQAFIDARVEQSHERFAASPASELNENTVAPARDFYRAVELPNNLVSYLTIGSQNQDYRGMLMDGEVLAVIPGDAALVATLDFAFLVAVSTWVDSLDELHALLPEFGKWQARVARLIREGL